MEAQQLKYILEGLQFSAAMPADVLEKLAAESTTQSLKPGEVLFREGSENKNLYFMRSGRLALEMIVPGRGAVRILTTGPGDMVGWSALLGRGTMTASAVALEPCELVVAPADKLSRLCQSHPDFGYHLMLHMAGALSKRLVATRLQLLDLFAVEPPPISPAQPQGQP